MTRQIMPNSTSMTDLIDQNCRNIYNLNNTGIFIKDYEGIPENLLVNVCAWLAILVLYTFLRRIGDYGRFGLLKNDEERWSVNFFSKFSDTTPATNSAETNAERADNDVNLVRSDSTISQDFTHINEYKEKNILSWILNVFRLKDKHINEKCGKDAIYYLFFQRYLITYLFIVTILSISVLLPINLQGNLFSSKVFGATTIVNVPPNSQLLWIHLILSWVFYALGIIFVKIFSKRMEYTESEYVSRTVLVTNYPSRYAKKEFITKHFEEAYPELVITDVQFAYNVNKLYKLDNRKHSMLIGKMTSEKILEQTGERPMMHPFHFGSFVELCCCCCTKCCCKQENNRLTDSIEFYTKKVNELEEKISKEREKCLKKPLGISFITFKDQAMADKFLKHYRYGLIGNMIYAYCPTEKCSKCFLCQDLVRPSSLSHRLNSEFWSAKYAPAPTNIKWENLSKIGIMWWFRCILINLILIILMIFFTTPSILIAKAGSWAPVFNVEEIAKILPSYLGEFLPSLLLRLLAALLPVLVSRTALAEMHWTRSGENRSMMVKTFTLLLFMVLVLPTLGLTSINAIFEWLNNKKEEDNIKWKCVSENGAFFLKYVTTCSLIGTALDLIRLPELFLYVVRLFYSRSSAERLAVRMKAAFEFDYGVQYAWILTVFTVTLCFSVVCPLITPFGLVYLILKHMVDRYNIYFAYVTTKVDKSIHKSAVKFALSSFIMLQFCILFFISLRKKDNESTSSMTVLQIIIIVVSCIIFFGSFFFGVFKRFTPFNYEKSAQSCGSSPEDISNDESYCYITESSSDSGNDTQNVAIEQPSPRKSDGQGFMKTVSKAKKMILHSPFIPAIIRSSIQDPYSKLDTKNSRRKSQDSTLNEENIDLEVRNSEAQEQDRLDYGTLTKNKFNENFLFQQENGSNDEQIIPDESRIYSNEGYIE